jgi:sirohydrochlorin ferrochelatase
MHTVILIDNGSRRAEAALSLRRLAAELGRWLGETVHPVSLLHSSEISFDRLEGRPAETFEPFLRRQLAAGSRAFVVLPLFFGRSRALTEFIPDTASALRDELGPFELKVAAPLVPLPEGEPRLVEILCDHVGLVAKSEGLSSYRVVLVDHGSPIPEVTAVRRWLAAGMGDALGGQVSLSQAVMERRQGSAYDFNGPLLEEQLARMAAQDRSTPVILSMLFLSPGRHAGPGGDIERICHGAQEAYPGFRVYPSALVGSHPRLLEILQSRYAGIV